MILSKEDQLKHFGTTCYTGSHIHQRFAYKILREKMSPTGNIFAFRAPMDVTTNLIDLEDKIAGDFIWSDDAVNLVWEVPGVCSQGAVYFQRLFCTQVAQILSPLIQMPIEVKGDDLYVHNRNGFVQRGVVQITGKSSVSIVYSKDNVMCGHLGININAGDKAPVFAYSTKLNDKQITEFMSQVCLQFNEIVNDTWVAAQKIII